MFLTGHNGSGLIPAKFRQYSDLNVITSIRKQANLSPRLADKALAIPEYDVSVVPCNVTPCYRSRLGKEQLADPTDAWKSIRESEETGGQRSLQQSLNT